MILNSEHKLFIDASTMGTVEEEEKEQEYVEEEKEMFFWFESNLICLFRLIPFIVCI